MNPYNYYPQSQGVPMQHLPQPAEPKIFPCVVETAEQLSTVPPMPNTIYLGLSRDGTKIFQRRMNNDGLMELKTFSLQQEQTKKTETQEILERIANIEKRLEAHNESNVNI